MQLTMGQLEFCLGNVNGAVQIRALARYPTNLKTSAGQAAAMAAARQGKFGEASWRARDCGSPVRCAHSRPSK